MGLNAEYGEVVTKSGKPSWTFITSNRTPALDRLDSRYGQ